MPGSNVEASVSSDVTFSRFAQEFSCGDDYRNKTVLLRAMYINIIVFWGLGFQQIVPLFMN
jgi:hypothetical protein